MVVAIGLFSATGMALNSPMPEITATGMDTVAGSPTILTSSQTYANTQVIFEVAKPDGSSISIPAQTDASGVARAMFAGDNTKEAGIYGITAKFANNVSGGQLGSFVVLAGPVSTVNSKVSPADQVIGSVSDRAFVTVTLLDDYENPISGHDVRLISSSTGDLIENTSTNVTDVNGQITFSISSKQSGAVVYTAYDVTADVVLNGKAKVAYFDDNAQILSNNIPSNYSYAAFGNASGNVDHLSFENVPMIINPGENISFKVTAYDNSDQVVMNYGGTVHFSVEIGDVNYVAMPSDYTFTPQDLGSHTFSVALGFQRAGSYQLRVQDTGNQAVYGQFQFVVGNGGQQNSGTVTITSPISGTYSNSVQVISGTASPGAKLKVFDGEIELASVVADVSGMFSFTSGVLADGLHKFIVAEVNGVGTILFSSSVVEVNIDTSGVKISSVVIEPAGTVDAGSQVTVKLYTGAKLSKASMLLADNIYELTVDPEGFYVVQIPAPSEFGEYFLSFILKDESGNETRVDNQSKLVVGGQVTAPAYVADVFNLRATTDDRRVILTWDTVTQSTNPIQNYRVYMGFSPTDLTTAIDTFTSATTWYVPNLENGTEYTFAVVAVDNKSTVSAHFSNIVTATPNPPVVDTENPDVKNGLEGSEDLDKMKNDGSKTGPEILWLVLVSAIGGICYSETARRKKL